MLRCLFTLSRAECRCCAACSPCHVPSVDVALPVHLVTCRVSMLRCLFTLSRAECRCCAVCSPCHVPSVDVALPVHVFTCLVWMHSPKLCLSRPVFVATKVLSRQVYFGYFCRDKRLFCGFCAVQWTLNKRISDVD